MNCYKKGRGMKKCEKQTKTTRNKGTELIQGQLTWQNIPLNSNLALPIYVVHSPMYSQWRRKSIMNFHIAI